VADHETLLPGNTPDPFSVIPVSGTRGRRWEDADMSVNGHLIALRDFDYVYFYPRLDGQTVAQALESEPCDFASATLRGGIHKNNFESVAFVDHTRVVEASGCDLEDDCSVALTVYELQTLISSDGASSPGQVGDWEPLSFEDFENGWGDWRSTGQHATLATNANFARGSTSARLRYRFGQAMIVLVDTLDATPYDQLEFSLEFILNQFDNASDDFFLDVSNDGGL
jgi:hypothetical protein